MNILKGYFLSQNKLLLVLPIVLFVLAFYIHYLMVMGYMENLYQFHNAEVREKILNNQIIIYRATLIANAFILVLQIIGIIMIMNVGLIFYGYEFKFKKLTEIVIKCSIFPVIIYLLLPLFLFLFENVYTFGYLYDLEEKLSLLIFFKSTPFVWLDNILGMITLSQILTLLFLTYGVRYLMNWNYKASVIITSKIYGLSFFICICFSFIMDLNFYQ